MTFPFRADAEEAQSGGKNPWRANALSPSPSQPEKAGREAVPCNILEFTRRRSVMSRICLGLICAMGLLVATGCPGGNTSNLNTVKVSGTVTLDGAPLPGATVTFSPKSDGVRAAFGTTDENGRFTLTTLNPGDGAVPGSYAVTVSKPVAAAASAPSQDPRAMGGAISPEEAAKIMAKAQGGAAGTAASANVVPAKYASAATSGLTAEVKSGADNTFPFELTSH